MLDQVLARSRRLLQWALHAGLLLACQLGGEALVRSLSWPLPGAVAGLLLLWCGLCILGRVPRSLELVASALLAHLMLPLIPLVAGLGEHPALLRAQGPALLLLCAGSVVATTVCAAAAYGLASRRQR